MGKRILVADDSQTIQKAFSMVLGAEHALLAARSMDEAISAAKSGRPDLVIADAVLGSASGYDLCAALKADPALRGVPVHILTSNQNPYDEGRATRAGADGFMVKPFDSQSLIDSVSAALTAPVKAAPASVRPAEPMSMFGGTVPDASADEDTYGEITIERAPVAPGPASWASRPAARPSGARAVVPTPPPPASVVTRPSLIPGTRPSASGMPVARPAAPGVVPAPAVPPPSTTSPVPRSMTNRTVMGFPAMAVGATAGPSVPPVTRPVVPARTPVPPTVPVSSPAAGSLRIPTAAPPLRAPVSPAAERPSVPLGTPAAPGMAPWRPAAPLPGSSTAPAVPGFPPAVAAPTPLPPKVAAAVASAVDTKMAALAARGPEYEAVAKLSREIIEQVVWEVVPELAELIIKQEVDRLASAKR